jgi:outer membrane protein TolC
MLSEAEPVPLAPATVAVGVPAETLRRRPDIRRAERELAAQTARIGVATAELYPKFHLNGSIGLESLAIEDLPEWSSRIFSIGPSATWNLFNAGAVRGNIEVQKARRDQALLQYRATVLSALEEVENALVAYARQKDRLNALTQAMAAAHKADLVARDRYKAGLVDFSNVLDAQRSLLAFDDEQAQSAGAVTADLIRLYKALGGGWESSGEDKAPPATAAQGDDND